MSNEQVRPLISALVNEVLKICEQEYVFSLQFFMSETEKEILKSLYLKYGSAAKIARRTNMNRTTIQMKKAKFLCDV